MNLRPEDEAYLAEYGLIALKCFLCDHPFVEGDQPSLIFEKRQREDGVMECALSTILSAALGCELDEEETHSSLLCDSCNNIVLEYENLEQRFCEMRYSILSAYNRTAQLNDLTPVAIEINGELHQPIELQKEEKNVTRAEYKPKSPTIVQLSEEFEMLDDIDVSSEAAAADLVEEITEEDDQDGRTENFAIVDSAKCGFLILNNSEKKEFVENAGEQTDDGQETIIYEQLVKESWQQPIEEDDADTNPSLQALSTCSDEDTDKVFATDSSPVDDNTLSFVQSFIKNQKQFYSLDDDGETYFCHICDMLAKTQTNTTESNVQEYMYENATLFQNHMRSEHKTDFFICCLCGTGFLKRKDMHKHLNEHHSKQYDCELCKRTFTEYRLFRIHKRLHYKKNQGYECSDCNKKYASFNLLEEHRNVHTGKRPFSCIACSKSFASKYSLLAHSKIHTERNRQFQCTICLKGYFNAYNLAQHLKLHVAERNHICEICSKAFTSQHNLDVHKIVHTGQRPFICQTCGKSFARRAEVKDHERTHTGERPYKCDLCPLAFAQRSNLMSHKKITHLNEKLHQCQYCLRSFKRRRLLEYHINGVHTGERPYKCDVCGSSFVYPEHLKKHMLIHGSEKPYACEVCGKLFHSRDNRNAHRFVHSTKKPYECFDCGAGYMRKPLLLAHMKKWGHSNDTIIVNQPQISELPKITNTSNNDESTQQKLTNVNLSANSDKTIKAIAMTKSTKATKIKPVVAPSDEKEIVIWQQMDKTDEEHRDAHTFNRKDNLNKGADEEIIGQFIKNQIGEVKYLQFEDLDKDGEQTLTWVDISAHDKN